MTKFVIVSTWHDDNLERATLPWVVANAALAADQEVLLFLQGPAANFATDGGIAGRQHIPFPPIRELVDSFIELGGRLYACGPCLVSRNITEDKLIAGASVCGASYLVEQMSDARVLSY